MVHTCVRLVGIWPASSGHNPGFQDRWQHLRKKQRHGPSQPSWLSLSGTTALLRNPSLHRTGQACLRPLFWAGSAFLLPSLRIRKQTVPSLMETTLPHPLLTVLLPGLSLTLKGEQTLTVQSASTKDSEVLQGWLLTFVWLRVSQDPSSRWLLRTELCSLWLRGSKGCWAAISPKHWGFSLDPLT